MDNKRIIDYHNIDLTVTAVEFSLSKRFPLNWRFKRTNRQIYSLIYIADGAIKYNINGKTTSAKKDEIVFLRRGDSYESNSVGDTNLEMIHLAFSLEPDSAAASLPFDTVIRLARAKRIKEMFMYVEEVWYGKGIGYKFYSKSLIQALIYELLKDISASRFTSKVMPGLLAARDYVDNYYDCNIKVETLANISGYSLPHFRKKFSENFGLSPIAYITHVRIEKAKDMLRSQLYTKDNIAGLCGFGNVHYFNRVFKKVTGITPGRY